MKLRDLVREIPGFIEVSGSGDIDIRSVSSDSREKTDNGLFFCIAGAKHDGHLHATQAVENGGVALVVTRLLPDTAAVQVLVENDRLAMAHIAAAFFGYPARELKLIGVTGTKGKTTTTYLLKAIMEQAGYNCGLIGTTGNMIGQTRIKSDLTTPDSVELQGLLRRMADEGVQVVCMEISAHALAMYRLEGLIFEVGGYTNLSLDHLDFFGTMEQYFAVKKSFFTSGMVKNASFNADEDTTKEILRDISIPYITYGICVSADLFARDIEVSENGVSFELRDRKSVCRERV